MDPAKQNPQASPDAPVTRIIEEHHIVGPHGEDEIQATDDRGRTWYELRPQPRRRADLMGFNSTWWLVTVLILVIAFLPW